MRIIVTLIAVIILTVGLTNRCTNRKPLFHLGYDGGAGTKRPQKVVQKSEGGDNTLIIISVKENETTAVKNLLGDTLYLKIKLAPDTIK